MATITIKSNITPAHTLPIDPDNYNRFFLSEQRYNGFPLLLDAFAKREPGEVLEVSTRAGGLKLRLVYDAAQDAYVDMTHGLWSDEHGRWMTHIEFDELDHERRFKCKRYDLCSCTREFSTSTRYERQHLVEQLHPGCTTERDSYDLSRVTIDSFDTEAEAMQALEAVRYPVRYSDDGDYFWVEEHFVEEYDVLRSSVDGDDVEEFVENHDCKWPEELSYRGRDYRWSAAGNQYIAVPDPADDEDDDAAE